ncbi:MAG: hypothetical protein II249_05880 [Bacteroidaceae bacterium]|nr:hypothetical protein [Bacteroidaceae bacterium]
MDLFRQARTLQHEGKYVEAIDAFKDYLLQPMDENSLDKQQLLTYSEALMQLMNTFQSKGEPEACVSTLEELYHASPILQKECLRDYCSIMGYALSRTEKMKEAEEMTLKVFSMPLNFATPERYFRDYAYAAAVFYSNPNYQKEVTDWCLEALEQARLCKNTSGKQWVTAMLGSIYKRNGQLSKALELFRQSKVEAEDRKDDLGVLNSLHMIVDLFLYWDVPEYADTYASEAIRVERSMTTKNPMVSAQTYINKGRAALQLGENDSVAFYVEKAREFCRSLPYNSGMVDIDLLHGIYLTERGGDSMHLGIQELQQVARQGTATNRTKAYYQLAQIYLQNKQNEIAEIMLDSMYSLIKQKETYIYAHLDYEPILNHYLKSNDRQKVELYTEMMFEGQQVLREKRLNFNLVEAITDLQTEQQKQEIEIIRLRQTNQRLWFLVYAILSIVAILAAVLLLFRQKKQHRIQMKKAGDKLASLIQKLNQTNAEKEIISQEIDDIMNDRETRQELESLAPSVLQRNGESRFRQRFELLYPLFLPRLRERVPTVTRREELLSMLIVLKQDNKEIADLLAIAPRSVLMLRHRFRQKIGMDAEKSLENFIEEILEPKNGSSKANEE